MTILEKATRIAAKAIGAREVSRDYAAGRRGRLTGDRHDQNLSANQEVKSSVRHMRASSRALARNNDYFIGFLKKLDANVIGTDGLTLQVDAKNADGTKKETLNHKVEREFKLWSRKQNCDVTGQSTLKEMASLVLRTVATDGEFLGRYIFDSSSPYSIKIQMLDVDWLDEDYNVQAAQSRTGNKIVMSVEYDIYDKPVAYHFTNPRWSLTSVPGLQVVPQNVPRLRITADQVIHRFRKDRIGQGRGVPWAHGAILTLGQLDGFDEAELVGARINASNMAFVSPPAPLDPTGTASADPIDTEVSPGQILELPPGYNVHEFSGKVPIGDEAPRRWLRKIATSFGVSYSTLTSDLTEVNFSSIRAGTIEERAIWRILQQWMADNFYQDIYEKWLMFNMQLFPASALDQIIYPIWQGRGFEWVDPLKDITASALAVDRGFSTTTEVLAERGKDFETTIDQIAAERKYMKSKDVTLAGVVATMEAAQQQIDAQDKQQEADHQAAQKNKSKRKD